MNHLRSAFDFCQFQVYFGGGSVCNFSTDILDRWFSLCWCTQTLEASNSPDSCYCRRGSYKDALLLSPLNTIFFSSHSVTCERGEAVQLLPALAHPRSSALQSGKLARCTGIHKLVWTPNCRERLQWQASVCYHMVACLWSQAGFASKHRSLGLWDHHCWSSFWLGQG